MAIIAVATLGNLRLDGSRAPWKNAAAGMSGSPLRSANDASYEPVALLQGDDDGVASPMDAATATGDESDPVELVPALYARDPNVRFVYDRRVSKWM